MIVVGLDPDREPGDVLDRVFPPHQSDDTFADRVDHHASHGMSLATACHTTELEHRP